MSNWVSASQAAELLGVSTRTLLRWEEQGKLNPMRTSGGHRRYDVSELLGTKNDSSLTIGYARCSSHDPSGSPVAQLGETPRPHSPHQKEDLKRQVLVLESYCASKGWNFEVIQETRVGNELSEKRINTFDKINYNLSG